MGTLQSIKPIEKIEQGISELSFYSSIAQIRQNLNDLENTLSTRFPEVNQSTAIPHLVLQQALRDYVQRINRSLDLENIKETPIIPGDPNSFPFCSAPNFLSYLSGFGEIGSSEYFNSFPDSAKVGVFLKPRNIELNPQFLGLIGISNDERQIEYTGYVPTNLSEKEFFKHAYKNNLWHLSEPPKAEGINFSYVRLFAEKNSQGKLERFDAFSERGIEFP